MLRFCVSSISRLGIVLLLASLAASVSPVRAGASDGAWRSIANGDAPTALSAYSVTYDPVRDRLYAYLGSTDNGQPLNSRDRDVWILDLADPERWTRLAVPGWRPDTGPGSSLVYDPVGDRLLVYGGIRAAGLVALNLDDPPAWRQLFISGGPALQLAGHAAILDSQDRRMILYGGWTYPSLREDVWALKLDPPLAWTHIVASGGPGPREYSQAVYDGAEHRLIVHGGNNVTPFSDVWALSLGAAPTWTQLSPSGGPGARYAGAASYDAAHHRMMILGGIDGSGAPLGDSWAYSLDPGGDWALLSPGPSPNPRGHFNGVFDSIADRFVVFGGTTGSGPVNDVWSIASTEGAAWSQVLPNQEALDERRDANLVWDPVRQRAVLYGGLRYNGATSQVWSLDATTPEWTQVTTAGAVSKHKRSGATTVWDPLRDRMLVFGGEDLIGNLRRDVMVLPSGSSPAWADLNVADTPAARKFAAGAYDPIRDRVLYFAGYPLPNARNQLWALNLGGASPSWTLLAPTGAAPTQRWGHTMCYDPSRDRMIVFGGGDGVYTNELWVLALAGGGQWTKLTGPGTPPPGRLFHSAIYDPRNDRLIISGGTGKYGVYFSDTWEYRFNGSGWRQVNTSSSPHAEGSAAIYDPVVHRMLMFGEFDANGFRRDTWSLDLAGQVTGIPGGPLVPARFALEGAQPNPAFGAPRIALSLPDGAAATLELIDIAGRRVRMQNVGSLGAGRHVVDLGSSGAIAPGLYFARLTREGETRVAKVCIAR